MKKALFSFLLLTYFSFAFAQHDGHSLSNAKIAHDASHRVGRLVDTGKLDEVFLKNMNSIEVKQLPHGQPTDPAYSATVLAGSSSQTVLTFDMKGKFLTNMLVTQGTSEDSPFDMNANELLEAAIHFVTEVSSPNIDLTVFAKGLNVATLKSQKTDDGLAQPIVLITANGSTSVLQISLSQKGEIVSYSLVQ